ncbi:MAG: NADH-quinone oxidoreductase subunit NuoG, partial [Pseudomonadota bacterium]
MAKLIIDGAEIEVPDHYTLLQACEAAGAEIPRFCFHERLSIAGNCRMCLVQVVGGPPKPIASCAMSVKDLRPGRDGTPPTVNTRTQFVKEAREGVMEFLLINHPLDCPICDQGGECDLQDQAMAYGVSGSRFVENKRAVEDKHIGPLVKTIMNRCIHCTRCVRFVTEVAGVPDLGSIGRGEDMEITTYLEEAMSSELQGNVIDLCPVGALTAKPYAFKARPWELTKTETIDAMDAVGSAIRVDVRGREVMRILPRLNEAVNEEWISDKSRFIWDGLRTQRLDVPYVRQNGALKPSNWGEAFAAIAQKVKAAAPERTGAIGGDLATAEELFALKDLMGRLGVASVDCRAPGEKLDPVLGRASYVFNPTIAGIEEADAILIIGANPRWDASLLNARIRKTWVAKGLPIGLIGERVDLTYPYQHLGAGPSSLDDLGAFGEVLTRAERPIVIVGPAAFARPDAAAVLGAAARIAKDVGAVTEDWNGFGILHTAAARVGGLDVKCVPDRKGRTTEEMLQAAEAGKMDVLFLLGVDEIDLTNVKNAFIVYFGTHGDRGAHAADVILPGAAYTEKSGT